MRIFPSFCSAFLLLCLVSPATAAPTAPAETAPPAPIAVAKAVITPHRAIYKMALASVKNGSNIAGVSGQMLFKWSDVCDGWAVEQHMKLHFNYAEGDDSDVTSTDVSWESKDGKRYNFNVVHDTDGKETERYKGHATLIGDKGGEVVYTIPKNKNMKLPAGTLFPTTHTQLIIQKALAGERLFTRSVFDGSDDEGYDDVSVFLNAAPKGGVEEAGLAADLKKSPLLEAASWPVRLAFFKTSSETGTPDYEMDMDLLANGVVKKMVIDYGDFTVIGTLSEIEALPASGC